MKIYDLFQYFGEDDLLEIRLNTHNSFIDKFFIVESPKTHSLLPKPLYLPQSKDRFSQFADKIVYLPVDYCIHQNAFYNDWMARVALFNNLPNEECIVLHSDLDEIADPEIVTDIIKNLQTPISIRTNYFMFCLDLWGRKCHGPIIVKKSWIRDDFYKYRDARTDSKIYKMVDDAGWHYSSVGAPEQIVRKWKAFAHYNEILDEYKDVEWIKSQIKRKAGSWAKEAKNDELKPVEHKYPNLPKYVLENKERFKHLLYENYLH